MEGRMHVVSCNCNTATLFACPKCLDMQLEYWIGALVPSALQPCCAARWITKANLVAGFYLIVVSYCKKLHSVS